MIEGFPSGRDGAAGTRARRAARRAIRSLVYGRMTGWGQDGPLAARAGHDIDYIALVGRAARDRPRERRPGAAAQSRRRLRRRRHAARVRRSCARSSKRGAPAAARWSTRRWSRARRLLTTMMWGLRGGAAVERRARHERARLRRAVVRHVRDARTAGTSRSAPSSPSSTPSSSSASGLARRAVARAARSRRLARRCASASPRAFATRTRDEWQARVRRLRCLRGAGAVVRGSGRSIRTRRPAART